MKPGRSRILSALEDLSAAAHMLLLVESPSAFRERNLLVGADARMRV